MYIYICVYVSVFIYHVFFLYSCIMLFFLDNILLTKKFLEQMRCLGFCLYLWV